MQILPVRGLERKLLLAPGVGLADQFRRLVPLRETRANMTYDAELYIM